MPSIKIHSRGRGATGIASPCRRDPLRRLPIAHKPIEYVPHNRYSGDGLWYGCDVDDPSYESRAMPYRSAHSHRNSPPI